ncbi:MAG TPA: helix-turn-helix transcriptional regulator [Pseudonocardiaceae bacterium]|nr:helix-turn-helix transcriptional regulator [Pseudonocardiaceae bacterium]
MNPRSTLDDAGVVAVIAAVGNQLRRTRLERGWHMKEVADRIEMSMSVLCRLELARREPSTRNLIIISGALGVRPSTVLHRAEDDAFPLGLAPWPV